MNNAIEMTVFFSTDFIFNVWGTRRVPQDNKKVLVVDIKNNTRWSHLSVNYRTGLSALMQTLMHILFFFFLVFTTMKIFICIMHQPPDTDLSELQTSVSISRALSCFEAGYIIHLQETQ